MAPPDGRALLERASRTLLDPLGQRLAATVQWWELPPLADQWPVAVLGQGPPLLLLHGFDSSHLEYRRLAPLLAERHQLFIPDLHGFGFCPRPVGGRYHPEVVLEHLERVLEAVLEHTQPTRQQQPPCAMEATVKHRAFRGARTHSRAMAA